MNNPLKISVVISVYNEAESLPALFEWIDRISGRGKENYEWLLVDDGSSDNSLALIRDYHRTFSHPADSLRYLHFSRNFGHEAAMIAGIDHASGDAVVCMDADLQHPPELLPAMADAFRKGKHIVNMVRTDNEGTKGLKKLLSSLFYRFLNAIARQKLTENASDFFLVSGEVAGILRKDFRERNRFLRGIIQTVGFPSTTIGYTAPARIAGHSKYSFSKLLALTSRAVTSFTKAPLFLGIWFGFAFALISLALGLYTLLVYLFGSTPPSGYTTIVLFMSFSFMILFFLIGIIGMYVGFLFEEQKKRPLYIIEEQQ